MAIPRPLAKVTLAAWVVVSVVMGGYVLAAHLGSLPAPGAAADAALVAGLRSLFPAGPQQGDALLVAHVLYERCGCSARVAASLAARGAERGGGVREAVIMVADDATTGGGDGGLDRLRAAGFAVVALPAREAAARLQVQAVPLLVIVGAGGDVRYAGGYTAGRERPGIEDGRLVAEVRAGRRPAALPIFGCAISAELQKRLDPLGIKY